MYLVPKEATPYAVMVILLMCFLMSVDILTKWLGLAQQYNHDKHTKSTVWSVFRAIFFKGWNTDYFQSSKLNAMLTRKIIPYIVVISTAWVLHVLVPPYKIMGFRADETIAMFLYLCVVFCEVFSIVENLKNIGFSYADFFLQTVNQLVQRLLGVQRKD